MMVEKDVSQLQHADWIVLNEKDIVYHNIQYQSPYRSTEKFVEWLKLGGYFSDKNELHICDMGCGGGANLYYLASKFPQHYFTGIELNAQLVEMANRQLEQNNLKDKNVGGGGRRVIQGDLYNLSNEFYNTFDGIILFQVLVSLPEYEKALDAMAQLNPRWIAFSSLFYEGNIDFIIRTKDYSYGDEDYYNIYSLPRIKDYLAKLGYVKFEYIPFDIDIDLPKPKTEGFGAYTFKTEDGKRLQMSAALLLPWYFVVASK